MDHPQLSSIIQRSVEFYNALHAVLADAEIDDSTHTRLTVSTSQVAIEHGVSICMLVEAGQLTSGHALFRTQFEATVRALWLCFAATDEWLHRYMMAIKANPAKDPNCSPGMDEMLKEIAQNAPPVIAPQLMELKQGIWGHLNSFVHTGVYPAAIQLTGYSLETALDAVRNANGLSSKSAMVIATVTHDEPLSTKIHDLQLAHLDCLPTLVQDAEPTAP